MEFKSLKLMIPGPVQPDAEVLRAMGSPVQPHYGPIFTEVYNSTLDRLRGVFNTDGSLFLMNGSGTVGIDACLGSAFSTGEKILVGVNGFFGERLKAVAEANGLQVVVVPAEPGLPLRAADFEQAFEQHPDAVGATVVHLETSTTIVNPVEEIGPVVRRRGGWFMVDAVSSLGGLPYHMDEWGIDLCASASQKCLGAPPGLSPVAVGKRGWEAIDRNPNKAHGWYSDLRIWRKYAEEWYDWHPFPITVATNNIMALLTSLDQLLAEGIEKRLERYQHLAVYLRAGLRGMGLEPFTPDELMAPVLTAARMPAGVSAEKVVAYLADNHGIKISHGLGTLKDAIIRIGHMSPTVSEVDLDEVLAALKQYPGWK